MREIVLDTETTGFEPSEGHRIVEIGAVELFNHLPTGRTYHQYLNPERSMPKEAFEVHGLGDDFLRDKPLFRDCARAFLDFVGARSLEELPASDVLSSRQIDEWLQTAMDAAHPSDRDMGLSEEGEERALGDGTAPAEAGGTPPSDPPPAPADAAPPALEPSANA